MEKKGNLVDKILALLVQQGAIAKKEVPAIHRSFAQVAQVQFDYFLLSEGLVEPDELLKALGQLYQVPSYDVTAHFFDTHLLHMFPKDFLLRNAIIPLEQDENMLVIVASEPEKEGLESAIREFVSYDINFFVGIGRDICDAVKEFYDKALTQVEEDQDSRQERMDRLNEENAVDRQDTEESMIDQDIEASVPDRESDDSR
ncbi:hypothetical protein CVU75_01415 [Candidatus Dependentiae bacterium HGW-Dependentiae-1]|nr:MAG: hypothetical protein CVU75_01415 [Candidatus Dependentiae bacterium HGW-Dependentiae-1]